VHDALQWNCENCGADGVTILGSKKLCIECLKQQLEERFDPEAVANDVESIIELHSILRYQKFGFCMRHVTGVIMSKNLNFPWDDSAIIALQVKLTVELHWV